MYLLLMNNNSVVEKGIDPDQLATDTVNNNYCDANPLNTLSIRLLWLVKSSLCKVGKVTNGCTIWNLHYSFVMRKTVVEDVAPIPFLLHPHLAHHVEGGLCLAAFYYSIRTFPSFLYILPFRPIYMNVYLVFYSMCDKLS